jgi:hypothetical protein
VKRLKEIRRIGVLGLMTIASVAHGQVIKEGPVPDPVAEKPLLDVALQSPAICRGPAGTFYLTGKTDAGVALWQSTDLKKWEALGQVWAGHVTSPKIHFIKGTFYIPYSRNGFGCGLLRSKTGKAQGPYEDLGLITPEGASLTLFEDEDKAVYMAMDEGWVARMKDDLSGPAERPRLVIPKAGSDLGNSPFTVGRTGAFLFKRQGTYYLAAAEWTSRTGYPVYDTYVAAAEKIDGPYECRHLMVAHGGASTVFAVDGDQWYATMGGDDVRARFRNRAALVPLEWRTYELYWNRGGKLPFPAKPMHVITERGVWDQLRPLTPDRIRDISVLGRGDYVYYTGSVYAKRANYKVVLFRFPVKDISRAARGQANVEMRTIMEFKDIPWLDLENRMKYGVGKRGQPFETLISSMDTKIHYMNGTFWMTFALYNVDGLAGKSTLDDGKTYTWGSGILRSKSGTWEGPWESVARGPYSHVGLREDEKGEIFFLGRLGKHVVKPDNTLEFIKNPGKEDPRIPEGLAGLAFGDDGPPLGCGEWNGPASLHIEGRPGGTYDKAVRFDPVKGFLPPYPRPTSIMSHLSSATEFRDDKGRWWHTFFGNDSTAPWFERMGMIPLTVRQNGNETIIDIADEWSKD